MDVDNRSDQLENDGPMSVSELRDLLKNVQGSECAKERAVVIMQYLSGACDAAEACAQMGVSEAELDQMCRNATQNMLDAMERCIEEERLEAEAARRIP